MTTPELIEYIQSQTKKNVSKDAIKDRLVSMGWKIEDVNEGLNLQKLQLDTPEKWFKNLLSKLTPATSPQYPNSIFYKLGDEINMVYDKENRHLYYSYENIYQVLESEYHLNNQQITTLVKGIVEEHYELGPLTPFEDRTI